MTAKRAHSFQAELLGHRRDDGAPIYRATPEHTAERFRSEGYEFRTWPSKPTTVDRWPSIRGWALPEDEA